MDSHQNLCHGECAKSSCSTDKNNEYAQTCLDAVIKAVWKDDNHDEFCGGTNSYKTSDVKVVFLTQAKSYHHSSPAFTNYSQLEFECIVQLQDKVKLENKSTKVHRCKPKPSFTLGLNHPLYRSNVGVF